MSGNDTSDGTETFDVVVTRVLDAPVEEVWKAWSDPERVMQWWGPTGFTSPSAEMDFRVGGVSLVCMRAPAEYGGQDMYNTWTYTRIDPQERIELVSNFADEEGMHLDPAAMGMPPGAPHEVPHVITFKVTRRTPPPHSTLRTMFLCPIDRNIGLRRGRAGCSPPPSSRRPIRQ